MRLTHYFWLLILLFGPAALATESTQAGLNPRGIVESAEISGIDEDELSGDVRDAVRALTGKTFDQQSADAVVERIHAGNPGLTATTRLVRGNERDSVKVIILVEKNESASRDENVNSRYLVERVEIQGYEEAKFSSFIRDELKTFIGQRLDDDKANQLQHRMDDELRPRRFVVKRVVKGSDRQHIVLIYDVHAVRLIPFLNEPPQHIVYHSKENFSAAVTAPLLDKRDVRLFVGLADSQDLLIERFAGFNFGFQTSNVGTQHLGLALRYFRYHERWQLSTVLSDPSAVYRERSTFEPSLTFAVDPRIRVSAGVSMSDLQMQYPAIHDANANAATASISFRNTWGQTGQETHSLEASFDVRAGNHTLDSDFVFTRHFAVAQYVYGHGRNVLALRFSGGAIYGNAPLFERFSLGDTATLRGWNKFDVAPLGGNRMAHATVEYGFSGPRVGGARINIDPQPPRSFDIRLGFHVFYDTGAVGDNGAPIKLRHAAGFGFGPKSSGFFMDFGFPIRTERVRPVFMMGFRF